MDERSLRWQQRFEWPMVVAALLVIPLLIIESGDYGETWDDVAQILNWATWLAFLTEAVVMVWIAPRPLQWAKDHPIDLAIIVLSPPFIPSSLAAARLFRLLRALRLLRIFELRQLLSLEGIKSAAFVVVFVVLVGGLAYSAVESEQGLDAWDGIWWALNSVTTLGYGAAPTTDIGRVIALVVVISGVGFVALLTAFIADRFIRQDATDELLDKEDRMLAELESISSRLERLERKIGS